MFSHRWPPPPDAGLVAAVAVTDGAGRVGRHWPGRRRDVGVWDTGFSAAVVGAGGPLEFADASLWYPMSALSLSRRRVYHGRRGRYSPADPFDSSAELALLGTGRLLSILVRAGSCAFIVNRATVVWTAGLLTEAGRYWPHPQGRRLCDEYAWLRGPLSKLAAWRERLWGRGHVGNGGGEGRETGRARGSGTLGHAQCIKQRGRVGV